MFCVIAKLCVILAMVSSSFLPSSPIMVDGRHSEEGSSKSISGNSTRSDAFVGRLQVLVVDDDEVNLKILKSLLTSYKHEDYSEDVAVVTVSRPTDALNKLHENGGGFDLVITDIHMPIMNGFDLLQIIKKDFKNIPVIMISSGNSKDIMLKALQRGACHYQPKPISESFIQTIWQYVFCKKSSVNNHRSLEAEGSVQEEASSRQKLIRRESIEISSSAINVRNWRQEENKRKRKPREYDDDDYEDDFPATKKTRMVWTPKLHETFMEAIDKIGLEKAVPRKILEVMNVPGVSRTNIASHLQKYRLYLKSNKDPNQSRRSFRNSRYYSHENRTSGYTPSYNSSMSYISPQGFAQFPEKQQSQFVSYQPTWGSNFCSLNNNALNMPSVGQNRFYSQGLSNESFMAQPRCGYSTQMFSNTKGNMGQPIFSSAPNYLNQQNVGSQQTFGMGTSLDGDTFSNREGDPIMHQFFPDAPIEQQKFSNADLQSQSNLQSFDTIDFLNLAPDANLTENNPPCKSNYVGFQLSNNEGVIGLRQTGMDSVEDSTVVNANVDQLDDIGNGMMSMEGVETSPMPNFDTNFNQGTPVGPNFTSALAKSNAFQTAPLITAMDQLQLQQPNEVGGILENWCDIIRNNSTNDISYLLSNDGGSQQNQVAEGLIMDPQFGISEFQLDENYSGAI